MGFGSRRLRGSRRGGDGRPRRSRLLPCPLLPLCATDTGDRIPYTDSCKQTKCELASFHFYFCWKGTAGGGQAFSTPWGGLALSLMAKARWRFCVGRPPIVTLGTVVTQGTFPGSSKRSLIVTAPPPYASTPHRQAGICTPRPSHARSFVDGKKTSHGQSCFGALCLCHFRASTPRSGHGHPHVTAFHQLIERGAPFSKPFFPQYSAFFPSLFLILTTPRSTSEKDEGRKVSGKT